MEKNLTVEKINRSFRLRIDLFIFLLFFIFFQNTSGQIYATEGTVIYTEGISGKEENSEALPDAKIYVTSATIITRNENDNRYVITVITQRQKNTAKKYIAAKNQPRKKNTKTNLKETKGKSNIVFSDLSSSHTFFSKASNTSGAVAHTYNKKLLFTSGTNLNTNFISEELKSTFIYSDSGVFGYHINYFFVRPPPVCCLLTYLFIRQIS